MTQVVQERREIVHFESSVEVSGEACTWFSWERRVGTLGCPERSEWLIW